MSFLLYLPSLRTKVLLNVLAWSTMVLVVLRLFVGFYYAVNFDKLGISWVPNDVTEILQSGARLTLFIAASTRRLLEKAKRLLRFMFGPTESVFTFK